MPSAPFGNLPADSELAAFGCGIGAFLLGVILPDAAALGSARPVVIAASSGPLMALAFALGALAVAVMVTKWSLRVALLSFAAAQTLSISPLAAARSAILLSLYAVAAGSLIVASWPRSSRLTRTISVLLFVLAALIKLAARHSLFGVFG